jgi:hypothetical protein
MLERIILLLTAVALLVVLTATTVSPAFAGSDPQGRGYGSAPSYKWCGDPKKCDESWGYACGAVRNGNKESAYPC